MILKLSLMNAHFINLKINILFILGNSATKRFQCSLDYVPAPYPDMDVLCDKAVNPTMPQFPLRALSQSGVTSHSPDSLALSSLHPLTQVVSATWMHLCYHAGCPDPAHTPSSISRTSLPSPHCPDMTSFSFPVWLILARCVGIWILISSI